MRLFITGGSGYIGLELARALAAGGHEVRALVRPTSHRQPLDELGVKCFVGDVTDRFSLRQGMSGSDWVIHAAAELDFGARPELMRSTNAGGAGNVASLAYKLGVGGLLALSSIAVFGGSSPDGTASTEASPPVEPPPSLYSLTKAQADRAIAEWAERGLAVTTVYPSLVYGPPGKRQGANALIRMVARGRMPAVVAGDRVVSWIHVADLVAAIVKLLERGPRPPASVAGEGEGRQERYILAGDRVRIGDAVDEVARLAGVAPPRWRISIGPAKLLARLSRPLYRLRGRRSPLLPDYLESLGRHWSFDDGKARRALGWRPRTLVEGLPETVDFLLEQDDSRQRGGPK